jgi:mannan endo-1,4-beta-mannosidase
MRQPMMFALALALSTLAATAPARDGYRPSDRRATREVREVLNYLKAQQGKGLVSGQTDFGDVKWIEANTGKRPVILGLDFMHVPTRMGKQTGDTDLAIDWFKNQKGIVTYQWHWSSPSGAQDPGSGFYAGKTSFDLVKALADPKSADYQGLLTDIDDVAGEIKKMNQARVPIIFRPLHEAQGTWFWWGAKGPEACVSLYKIIHDRLTKRHRLHNIIWAWTAYPASQKKGDPAAWYPGDNLVDIVVSDYCESKGEYDELVKLTNGKKMVALAETMNAPDPDKVLTSTPWAYWVTWARRDWNNRSNDDMKRAIANPKTITLDQRAASLPKP